MKGIKDMEHTKNPDLRSYLKGYMLDYVNFEVIEIIPQSKRFAATIMRDKRADSVQPWCVQYGGGGHYFYTREDLDEYCRKRGWYKNGAAYAARTGLLQCSSRR